MATINYKSDKGIDIRLSNKQLSILFENIITTTLGYLVVSATLVYLLWPHVNHSLALNWLALLIFVAFMRFFLLLMYRKNKKLLTPQKWFQFFYTSTICAALIWGSTSLMIFPANSPEFQMVLLLFVAGLVAGAIASLSASFSIFIGFVTLSLVPLSIRFFYIDSETSTSISLIILFYVFIILVSGRKTSHNLMESIKLRIEGDERESDLMQLTVQLQESEEKYRRLFELSDDPMWIIVDDRFVIANESSSKVLGFKSTAELLSIHPSEVSPEIQEDGQVSFDKSNEMIKQAYAIGYHRFEWHHKKNDDTIFPVEVTLTKIPYEGGDALFCVWRDITKQKKTASALNLALEEAKKSIMAKGQFLATMSHEIRTPLNGVLGISQLLGETNLNAQQKEYVDTILTSGQMLLYIINDILDYSKLDANKMKLDPTSFNLEKIIDEVVDILKSNANKKELSLSSNFSDNSVKWISADANRIRQVLFNIIGNAIKFTEIGTIEVKVTTVETNKGFVDALIQIIDTGVGIEEKAIDALFNPFTQADLSTTRTYGGTGLGLSICKKIVSLMKGTIKVNSKIGEGTTFSLSLPLAIANVSKEHSNKAGHHTSKPELVPSLTNMNILLVEDNSINQMIAKTMIEKLGHTVIVADNGLKAVDICFSK